MASPVRNKIFIGIAIAAGILIVAGIAFLNLNKPDKSEVAIQDVCTTWNSLLDDANSGVLTNFELRERAVVLYEKGKKTTEVQFQDATRIVLSSLTNPDFDSQQFEVGRYFLTSACDKLTNK